MERLDWEREGNEKGDSVLLIFLSGTVSVVSEFCEDVKGNSNMKM